MTYLTKMTVVELKEIAKRMSLPYSMRKAELVALITEYINGWHTIANDMNRTMHVDVPSVIDTEEFPMDHAQFTSWYNRHGGLDSFDGVAAISADHAEALKMNEQIDIGHAVTDTQAKGHAQVEAWWVRHGLDKIEDLTAKDITAARTKDHMSALALNYLKTYRGIGNGKRVQNYVRQNGTLRLTAAQNRRITKKGNREYAYTQANA